MHSPSIASVCLSVCLSLSKCQVRACQLPELGLPQYSSNQARNLRELQGLWSGVKGLGFGVPGLGLWFRF